MIRVLGLYLFFTLPPIFALDLQDCALMSEYNGDINSALIVSDQCALITKEQRTFRALNKNYDAFGAKNLLYVQTDQSLNLLAGKSTKITELLDGAIDVNKDFIYVLNRSDEQLQVLAFPLAYGGNLVSRKTITFDQENAKYTHLALDNEEDRLYLISRTENLIHSLDLSSDDKAERVQIHSEELDLSSLRKALFWQKKLVLVHENQVEIINGVSNEESPSVLSSFMINQHDLDFSKIYISDDTLFIGERPFELASSY